MVMILLSPSYAISVNSSFKREKYNEDILLINQTTMAIARDSLCSTAYYADGEMRVLIYVL